MKVRLLFLLLAPISCYTKALKVKVDAHDTKKVKLAVVGMGEKTALFERVCKTMHDDLQFSHQLDPELFYQPHVYSKKEVKELNKKGYPIAVFVSEVPDKKMFEVRVYNTKKVRMLKGYKLPKEGKVVRGWGHALANAVQPVLTGNQGCFASKIAYCKEDGKKKSICVADFNGKYEKELVSLKTAAVAPRWNKDPHSPLLLFSEYTPVNVRLMSVNMRGKKNIAVNFDGLNMLPAFSEDGKEVVMCLSRDGSSQLYHYGYSKKTKKVGYTRLTHNNGNNISPTLLANGDIVFCSDYETRRPHIYHLKRKRGTVTRLSEGGSCFAPSYSSAAHKIAYSQMVKGVSQVMVYDLATGNQKQITHDYGHKQECSWSPCGNYLLFSVEQGKNKRIAVQSLLMNKRRYLTSTKTRCSYPSWSVNYSHFPRIG